MAPLIAVSVYTNGGNVLSGQMTESQAIELVAIWSDRAWRQTTLLLANKDDEIVSIAYVRYEQIAAIDYVLGL